MHSSVQEADEPKARTWHWWATLTLVLVIVIYLANAVVSNHAQWARVMRVLDDSRYVDCQFGQLESRFGTSLCGVGGPADPENPWQRAVSWPTLPEMRVGRQTALQTIPWASLSVLGTRDVAIDHAEFSDSDLLRIPSSTPLAKLRLRSPRVTNQSIAKLKEFRKLQEVDLIGTSIDRQGLLQIVKETNWRLHVRMTTADLLALRQTGALPRIGNYEVVADGDFNVAMLSGVGGGQECAFRGKYDAGAFTGASRVLVSQQVITFQDAELVPQNLQDIAAVSNLFTIRIADCKVAGGLDEGTRATLTIRPAINKELNLAIRRTEIDPSLLRYFEGPYIHLYCNGPFADDVWLQGALQTRGLRLLGLYRNELSDAAIAKLQPMGSKVIYRPMHFHDWLGFPLDD